MTTARDILRILDEYERKPESYGVKLRLNLAELVIQQLNVTGWSMRQLAETSGVSEAYISRILHSDANCSFDTVGKILFALGVRARLQIEPGGRTTAASI